MNQRKTGKGCFNISNIGTESTDVFWVEKLSCTYPQVICSVVQFPIPVKPVTKHYLYPNFILHVVRDVDKNELN